eukprot:3367566-Rhodomonas_salina.2
MLASPRSDAGPARAAFYRNTRMQFQKLPKKGWMDEQLELQQRETLRQNWASHSREIGQLITGTP